MARHLQLQQRTAARDIPVAGVDVGGAGKGFHAVALVGGQYEDQCASTDVGELIAWCREVGATVIAVDAPCRWSTDGHARPAERQLMEKGIWCFSTPTRQRAIEHPSNHYGWMLRGQALFQALRRTHPLCSALPESGQKCCFETFPHAITWHLRGGNATASRKRQQRRELLKEVGINLTKLTNIDLVDAALCALTAHIAATGGTCQSYGTADTGLIMFPESLKP